MSTTRTAKKPTPKQTDDTVYGEREAGFLSGNVTMEPELRFTSNGKAVCNVNVAVNDKEYNPKTKKWEETEAEFHRITIWGEQGERCAEFLSKGDRIVAVGTWQDRTYTNKEGERKTVAEFTARDIGPSMLWKDVTIKRVTRTNKQDDSAPF